MYRWTNAVPKYWIQQCINTETKKRTRMQCDSARACKQHRATGSQHARRDGQTRSSTTWKQSLIYWRAPRATCGRQPSGARGSSANQQHCGKQLQKHRNTLKKRNRNRTKTRDKNRAQQKLQKNKTKTHKTNNRNRDKQKDKNKTDI